MTAKEKAIELFDKFNDEIPSNDSNNVYEFMQLDILASKQCALIAVDQILDNTIGIGESGVELSGDDIYSDLEFWEEVKQELEKL